MDEVTGGWRKMHIDDIRNLYSCSSAEGKENGIGRACCTNVAKRISCRLLVGKPERKRPPESPK
jgi:hypothetical protein